MKKIFIILFVINLAGSALSCAQTATAGAGSQCTFAGKSGGNLSRNDLASAKTLQIISPDSSWNVKQFKLSIYSKEGHKEFDVIGNSLNEEMLTFLKQAPAGSKVYFEYIRASKTETEGTRQIAPLAFTVVD